MSESHDAEVGVGGIVEFNVPLLLLLLLLLVCVSFTIIGNVPLDTL